MHSHRPTFTRFDWIAAKANKIESCLTFWNVSIAKVIPIWIDAMELRRTKYSRKTIFVSPITKYVDFIQRSSTRNQMLKLRQWLWVEHVWLQLTTMLYRDLKVNVNNRLASAWSFAITAQPMFAGFVSKPIKS